MNKSLHHGHPLLRVEKLSIQNFRSGGEDSKILDEISFDVFPGEIVGLIGESGSGKTISSKAILRMLPHSMKITNGSISFKDIDLLSLNDRQYEKFRGKSIALIPQDALHALNPVQKIGTQVAEPFSIHGDLTKKEKKSKVFELFSRVNITNPENRYDNYPHEFSGGMQQRALTASSIALKPPLIIADEPTTALDVTIQARIVDLIRNLSRELGISFLFISHDLGLISNLCDRVYVMRYGKIIESGNTETIFKTASHPYTLALMNSRPKLLENPHRLTTIEADNGYKRLDENGTKAIIVDPKAGSTNQASRLLNKATSNHESKVLFEVKNLSKTYSNNGFFSKKNYQKALTNVNFKLALGENLGIVGESGSGKTTILRILLKLTPYKEGSVDFSGKELNEIRLEQLKDFRRNVQPVFQDPYSTFNPRFSIKSSLELACKLSPDKNESRVNSEVKEMFNLVGLDQQLLHSFPHQLSGGQRQRAAIARALLCRPKILLMDEPTSALDVSIQAQVLNLIKDLQAQFKFSIIIVTHDLPVVSFLCNRILVMKDGKVVETGETGTIIKSPSHDYTKNLIQSVPI